MTDDWREKVGEGNEVEWKKRKEKHALLSRSVCFLFSFCSFHSFLLSFFAQSFVPLHYTSFILFICLWFIYNGLKWNGRKREINQRQRKRAASRGCSVGVEWSETKEERNTHFITLHLFPFPLCFSLFHSGTFQ